MSQGSHEAARGPRARNDARGRATRVGKAQRREQDEDREHEAEAKARREEEPLEGAQLRRDAAAEGEGRGESRGDQEARVDRPRPGQEQQAARQQPEPEGADARHAPLGGEAEDALGVGGREDRDRGLDPDVARGHPGEGSDGEADASDATPGPRRGHRRPVALEVKGTTGKAEGDEHRRARPEARHPV